MLPRILIKTAIVIVFLLPFTALSVGAGVDENDARINRMVGFLEYILNTVGNSNSPAASKNEIINASYLKLFENDQVQIEDDLDEHRVVSINKSIQAYLKDVDFFYKNVHFKYHIEDISLEENTDKRKYFKVKTRRELTGINLEGEQVSNSQVRYIEININGSTDNLKIARIYSTKLTNDDIR